MVSDGILWTTPMFFISGEYSFEKRRNPISHFIKKAYLAYFGVQIENKDKSWLSHFKCKQCVENLGQWTDGKGKSSKFGVRIVYVVYPKKPSWCLLFFPVNIKKFNRNSRHKWTCSNMQSTQRPLPQIHHLTRCSSRKKAIMINEGHSATQQELNGLVRDLNLSKENLLCLGSNITFYRSRGKDLLPYFSK